MLGNAKIGSNPIGYCRAMICTMKNKPILGKVYLSTGSLLISIGIGSARITSMAVANIYSKEALW